MKRMGFFLKKVIVLGLITALLVGCGATGEQSAEAPTVGSMFDATEGPSGEASERVTESADGQENEASENEAEEQTEDETEENKTDAVDEDVPDSTFTDSIELYQGEVKQVVYEGSVISLDDEIASASEDGSVTGMKKGSTELTVTSDEDGMENLVEVNVKKGGFMLPEITMLVGEYVDLQYQFSKDVGEVTWSSSNESVVKVGKNGSKITAKRKGKADIVGETAGGKHVFICHVKVEKKPKNLIYLTFDDGPSSTSTPKILKILKKNKVKATFFELKPAESDYKLTRRVINEGHTLAIHGYSHVYADIYKSDSAYKKNLDKLQSLFYKKFGVWCTLTRFPGGSSNTVSRHYSSGIMTRLSKKVPKWGYLYFDWNVSSGDAGDVKSADEVYKMVTSGIQKGRSNVVLMHDFQNNTKTINALQRIIDYGKKNGYEFRALTPATAEVHHGINN